MWGIKGVLALCLSFGAAELADYTNLPEANFEHTQWKAELHRHCTSIVVGKKVLNSYDGCIFKYYTNRQQQMDPQWFGFIITNLLTSLLQR